MKSSNNKNDKEIQTMAHCNTILNQIASFLLRHYFEKLAQKYHRGQKFRSFSSCSQFMAMTIAQLAGRKSLRDLEWARPLNIPQGSYVVFDRGYTDYCWSGDLDKRNITFVTKLKSNSCAYHLGNRRRPDSENVLLDQKVKHPRQRFTFHQLNYVDPKTGIQYQFLTNSKKLKASEVVAIDKERWQIELFFKWIKQNFKVKTFLGTSPNAVLTQLWIALLCVFLLLSYFKYMAKFRGSISEILRLLQLKLFERRPFSDLLKLPDKASGTPVSLQFGL